MIVAQTPPAPKPCALQLRSCPAPVPPPLPSSLLPLCISLPRHCLLLPGTPPTMDLGTSDYARIHLPKPRTLPEAREWRMQRDEGMEAKPQGHRGGQPSLVSSPALSHYGLDGLGKLFLMVTNMATLGRGLACYCSFSTKMDSGLFWAGDRTCDLEAGQSRPGPRGKAFAHPCSQARVAALPEPALPIGECEKATRGSTARASGQSSCSRHSPTLSERLS